MSAQRVEATISKPISVGKGEAGVTFDIYKPSGGKLGRLKVSVGRIRCLPHHKRSGPFISWKALFDTKEPKGTLASKLRPETTKASSSGKPRNRWTPEAKADYAGLIKAGKATYKSIARDLGITPQTVFAQLKRKDRSAEDKG